MAGRIADVEAIPIGVPLPRPLRMSFITVERRESILVRVRTEQGAEGIGDAMAVPYFTGETALGAQRLIPEVFAPALVGLNPLDLGVAVGRLEAAAVGNPAARAAVDGALHDLAGRLLGVPVSTLLGGRQRDRVEATWHVSNMDPEADARDAADAVRRGFRILKIKVGAPDPRRDLLGLRAIREAVGEDVRLYVDANQAWRPDQAIRFVRRAEEYGVELIEQPVARWDLAGMAAVARAVEAAVAPDEGVWSAEELLTYARQGAATAVVAKLIKSGGIVGLRRLVAVAEAADVGLYLAAMPGETSVSAAAAIHLACAIRRLPFGTAIAPHYIDHDIVREPIRPSDGVFHPLDGPGLGVELDPAAVEACRLDR
jgi:L-alanine-DL-glutamate epimerase-like enolase superfamily enzyme